MLKFLILFACVIGALATKSVVEEGENCSDMPCNRGLKCDESNACVEDEEAPLCFKKHLSARRKTRQHILDVPIPRCEENGDFKAVQCIGSMCACHSKEGERIEPYVTPIYLQKGLTCKCARDQFYFRKTGMVGKMYFCETNGNYKKIQCHGSVCFCADENGSQIGTSQAVHISKIAELKCD